VVHAVHGLIGANFDRRTTAQEFDLMTKVNGNDGYTYYYCQANGAIAASQTDVTLSTAGQASDGAGSFACTTAFADNEYGWVYQDVLEA